MGRDLSDLAASPEQFGLAAVAALDGTVWLTTDGGQQWSEVLPTIPVRLGETSTDERIRREFEAAVSDVFDGPSELEDVLVGDDEEVVTDIDELNSEIDRIVAEVSIQVQSELSSNPEFFLSAAGIEEQQQVLTGRTDTARPRVWFLAGQLFVTRADGIWQTTDQGGTWTQVFELPATALVEGPRGFVAGTRDGLRYSDDGSFWQDRLDGTEGLFIYDLERHPGGGYLAGTSDGLWASDDGEVWFSTGVVRAHALAVLADPDDPGDGWFSANGTVYRTREDGREVEEPFDAVLPDALDLVWWQGHLLAGTADGPQETTDGGATWTVAARGLSFPRTRALAVIGTELVIATREGLFHLAEYVEGSAGELVEWVALEDLLLASVRRQGMSDIVGSGARLTSSLLPQLRVELRAAPGSVLGFTDASGTRRGADGVWSLVSWLEWQPDGRKRSASVDAIIVDGEMLIDDGRDRALLASRVSRRAATYRTTVITLITEFYSTRAELVGQRARFAQAPLQTRVEHEIRILELEAELDALTDGAVSRYEAGRSFQEFP